MGEEQNLVQLYISCRNRHSESVTGVMHGSFAPDLHRFMVPSARVLEHKLIHTKHETFYGGGVGVCDSVLTLCKHVMSVYTCKSG